MKTSSGTLLYRENGSLEVLLIHPSGAYNKNAAWSIPKGKQEPGETLEETARRETFEETGVTAKTLTYLGYVDYKSGKRVHAFAGLAPENAILSLASEEVDRVEFVPINRAKKLLHYDQKNFIDMLTKILT